MKQAETIVAIATPNGKSALAIIRISGPKAFEIVSICIRERQKFETAPACCIKLYTIVDLKKRIPLDEATAIKYAAPRSFTGENMVEIICHGGSRVVADIAATLISAGGTPAGRGEFTQRAHTNGKIDLLRAEAIKGIIESTGDIELSCARKLFNQDFGIFKEWRENLIEICAKVEADIEFGEEEEINKKIESIEKIIAILKKEMEKREIIRNVDNFIQIVIAGPVNAGKSSLFNLLLGKNRAIVHSEPGTTRDIISEQVWIGGYHVLLVDSAGIRETTQEIEKEGIRRSRQEIKKAAIILWVTDANQTFSNEEIDEIKSLDKKELICVINKTDLSSGEMKKKELKRFRIASISISTKGQKNTKKLVEKIEQKLKSIYNAIEIPNILLNLRQEKTGKELLKEMCSAREEWKRPEIAAYHLKRSINLLDELFGKIDNEEILNKIFSSFCIGK